MNHNAMANEQAKDGYRVMDAIRQNEVRMRPRSYFIWRAILVGACALLLTLLLLYFVSLIIFSLHEDGLWFAPNFGLSGLSLFFEALPWGMLLVSFILLILVANLMTRYAFIYHQPLFYFLLILIAAVTLGGFFFAAELQPGLFKYAATNVPILGSFYGYETAMPASVHRGVVVSEAADGFVIADGFGVTTTVVAAQGVSLGIKLRTGDTVIVFGTRGNDGVIRAFGVERVVM